MILPITDPYVVHHGALGGYATVYLAERDRDRVMRHLGQCPGILSVHGREDACDRFALPPDRIGDIVVVATAGQALGTTQAEHDLSALEGPLRSHGGLAEQEVPIYCNLPLAPPGGGCGTSMPSTSGSMPRRPADGQPRMPPSMTKACPVV